MLRFNIVGSQKLNRPCEDVTQTYWISYIHLVLNWVVFVFVRCKRKKNDHFYEVGSSYDEFYDMDKFKICFHFKDTNSLF